MSPAIGWSWEPSVVLGSLALAGGYLACVGPRRKRFRGSSPVPRWRVGAFLAGVGALFLALASPLDDLSDHYLLTAHMVQHLVLTLIVPPLLLLGTPAWLIRPTLRSPLVAGFARLATRPLVAFASFNLIFSFSHFPIVYNYTLEHQWAHITQHLVYISTAVVLWWPILSPLPEYPRLAYPLQMLYLFLQTVPGALIGSFITLANGVLYAVYASAPRVSVLTAQTDQQLAGMIMWLATSLFYFVLLTVIFFVWASREQSSGLATEG